MTEERSQFPWSDIKIEQATKPRALELFTEEEEQVREDLMIEGMRSIFARRRGGRTRRTPAARSYIRHMIIEDSAYPGLSRHLKKTPLGSNTVAQLRKVLESRGFSVSEETIRRDLKQIGLSKLRAL